MKKLLIGCAAATVILGVMFPAHAKPRKELMQVTTATQSVWNVASTSAIAPGYIDEIYIDVPSGTGDVTLSSKETGQSLVSKATMSADTQIRPVVNGTSTDGTVLGVGTNAWMRYNAYGETLIFAVTNANTTNVTWKCWIKFDDGR